MEINASSLIRHPRERVYRAYRDELPKIIAFVPNVEAVNVLSRKESPDGQRVSLHNEWIGRSEIPKVAQGLVKPEMLRWDDFAEWDEAKQEVRWELKIRMFTEKMRCSGYNRFFVEGPGLTRVHLTGTLDIDLRDIPGVPRFLASSIAPQVEKFIITLIKPNLEQVNDAIGRYLDSQAR